MYIYIDIRVDLILKKWSLWEEEFFGYFWMNIFFVCLFRRFLIYMIEWLEDLRFSCGGVNVVVDCFVDDFISV